MSGSSPQRRTSTPKGDDVKADAALPFPGARPPSPPYRGGGRRASLKYDQLINVANSALDDEDLEIGLKVSNSYYLNLGFYLT
jgi:hypothetical protein